MDPARRYLDMAARLAWRGIGLVEPNPMVGAVIVKNGSVVGMGHHRVYGGAHAEVEAIADCLRRGLDTRGGTMYVTLEPCNHTGKTPPCTSALIVAGISRVVIAREDPNPAAAGGAAALRKSGVDVEFTDASEGARLVSDPFVKRVKTGLPWVTAKWAQTADGRLITGPSEPRWISCKASRRRVHRMRGRVDAILTGIGTVIADDPLLTARGTRLRRAALRVVIDSGLRTPLESQLARTASRSPVLICCSHEAIQQCSGHAGELRLRGVEVAAFADDKGRLGLAGVLRFLASEKGVSLAMVEAGPGLLGSFLNDRLVDEAVVFEAPGAGKRRGAEAPGAALPDLVSIHGMSLRSERRSGVDRMLCYRREVE